MHCVGLEEVGPGKIPAEVRLPIVRPSLHPLLLHLISQRTAKPDQLVQWHLLIRLQVRFDARRRLSTGLHAPSTCPPYSRPRTHLTCRTWLELMVRIHSAVSRKHGTTRLPQQKASPELSKTKHHRSFLDCSQRIHSARSPSSHT